MFLQDTEVNFFQPAVVRDFLKLKSHKQTTENPQLEVTLSHLLAYYFALRQDQFYLLFKTEVCLASL